MFMKILLLLSDGLNVPLALVLACLQTAENGAYRALRVPDLGLSPVDAVQHRPVGKDVVEKEVGKAEKVIHLDPDVGADIHIRQLRAEPGQGPLQAVDLPLGVIQMGVLGHVADEAAAEYVPGAPALGGGQGLLDAGDV